VSWEECVLAENGQHCHWAHPSCPLLQSAMGSGVLAAMCHSYRKVNMYCLPCCRYTLGDLCPSDMPPEIMQEVKVGVRGGLIPRLATLEHPPALVVTTSRMVYPAGWWLIDLCISAKSILVVLYGELLCWYPCLPARVPSECADPAPDPSAGGS
jgi:hypothetical protein